MVVLGDSQRRGVIGFNCTSTYCNDGHYEQLDCIVEEDALIRFIKIMDARGYSVKIWGSHEVNYTLLNEVIKEGE
jgi:hypothetical protein